MVLLYKCEDLAKIGVNDKFNITIDPEYNGAFNKDNFWSKTDDKSKIQVLIEIELINIFVN